MTQVWMGWCRLCAREAEGPNSHINVLLMKELSNTIYDCFSIEIKSWCNFINMICTDCYNLTKAILNLKHRIPRVTAMFSELLATTEEKLDLCEIKTRHNLECDLETFTISPTEFEAKGQQLEETKDQEVIPYLTIEFEANTEQWEESVVEEVIPCQNISMNPIKLDLGEDKEDNSCHFSSHEEEFSSEERKNEIFIQQRKRKYKSKTARRIEEKSKPHYCSKCHKGFLKLFNFNRHMQRGHGISVENKRQLFVCVKCGKKCTSRSSLKEHEFTHSEEKTFKCKNCEKAFKTSLSLKQHLDTHNDTSYICVICGLQLNTQQTLRKHMVVHSDQKKYKCDYCGKKYKRDKALKVHLILHTGLKPFTCDFCDKAYANVSNRRNHKKKKHPAELAAQEASGKNNVSNAV